jgi:hypothetical protein
MEKYCILDFIKDIEQLEKMIEARRTIRRRILKFAERNEMLKYTGDKNFIKMLDYLKTTTRKFYPVYRKSKAKKFFVDVKVED